MKCRLEKSKSRGESPLGWDGRDLRTESAPFNKVKYYLGNDRRIYRENYSNKVTGARLSSLIHRSVQKATPPFTT